MRELHEVRDLADQAAAEAASGAFSAGDAGEHDYLAGLEDALRWVAGDATTPQVAALLGRAARVDEGDDEEERIRDTDFDHPIGVNFTTCGTCGLPVDLALPHLIQAGGVHHTEHRL